MSCSQSRSTLMIGGGFGWSNAFRIPIGKRPIVILLQLAAHPSEYVRWWAVQLLAENKQPEPTVLQKFASMARDDSSAMVRLSLASVLQRIQFNDRWQIVEPLLQHAEDDADKDLPLMLWYAIEPLVPASPSRAAAMASHSKIKLIREYIARRIAAL